MSWTDPWVQAEENAGQKSLVLLSRLQLCGIESENDLKTEKDGWNIIQTFTIAQYLCSKGGHQGPVLCMACTESRSKSWQIFALNAWRGVQVKRSFNYLNCTLIIWVQIPFHKTSKKDWFLFVGGHSLKPACEWAVENIVWSKPLTHWWCPVQTSQERVEATGQSPHLSVTNTDMIQLNCLMCPKQNNSQITFFSDARMSSHSKRNQSISFWLHGK